jgi:hypothetical protein
MNETWTLGHLDRKGTMKATLCPRCKKRKRYVPGDACAVCKKEYAAAWRKRNAGRLSGDYRETQLHRLADAYRPKESE